jgi:hypothetical protein
VLSLRDGPITIQKRMTMNTPARSGHRNSKTATHASLVSLHSASSLTEERRADHLST